MPVRKMPSTTKRSSQSRSRVALVRKSEDQTTAPARVSLSSGERRIRLALLRTDSPGRTLRPLRHTALRLLRACAARTSEGFSELLSRLSPHALLLGKSEFESQYPEDSFADGLRV